MRVAASQTKWMLGESQRVLRNKRRYPRPRSGKEAYIEIKPAATEERSWEPGYVVVQTAGSHARVAPVLGIHRR